MPRRGTLCSTLAGHLDSVGFFLLHYRRRLMTLRADDAGVLGLRHVSFLLRRRPPTVGASLFPTVAAALSEFGQHFV
jgi:hypothetical protein